MISTRQGTKDRPLVHYGRDAGTDVIAASVASGLGGLGGGLVPHIVTCHLHRSKVEVNVDLGRRAVQERGQEAEFVHRLYHRSVSVISPTSPSHLSPSDGSVRPCRLADLPRAVAAHFCWTFTATATTITTLSWATEFPPPSSTRFPPPPQTWTGAPFSPLKVWLKSSP